MARTIARPCFLRRLVATGFRTAAARSVERVIDADATPFMLDPANPYWDFNLDTGDDADAAIDAGTSPSLDLR